MLHGFDGLRTSTLHYNILNKFARQDLKRRLYVFSRATVGQHAKTSQRNLVHEGQNSLRLGRVHINDKLEDGLVFARISFQRNSTHYLAKECLVVILRQLIVIPLQNSNQTGHTIVFGILFF